MWTSVADAPSQYAAEAIKLLQYARIGFFVRA